LQSSACPDLTRQVESIKHRKKLYRTNFSLVYDINTWISQKCDVRYSLRSSANWDIPLDAVTTERIEQRRARFWEHLSSSFKCFTAPRRV
jgi:hypothetical protein